MDFLMSVVQQFFGGIAMPGGSNLQIQYNNAGAFGGIPGSSWDGATLSLPTLTIGAASTSGGFSTNLVNSVGQIVFNGSSSSESIVWGNTSSGQKGLFFTNNVATTLIGFLSGNFNNACDIALSRSAAGIFEVNQGTPTVNSGSYGSIKLADLFTNNTNFLLRAGVALANAAAAATATMTNAPVAGNPTKWISIDDAGVTRRIPAW